MSTPTAPPLSDAERAELLSLRARERIFAEAARIATANALSFAEVCRALETYTELKVVLADARRERDAALRHAAEWQERAGKAREEGRREERAAIHAIVTAAALSSPDYAVSGRGLLAELERRGHVAGGSGGQRQ